MYIVQKDLPSRRSKVRHDVHRLYAGANETVAFLKLFRRIGCDDVCLWDDLFFTVFTSNVISEWHIDTQTN